NEELHEGRVAELSIRAVGQALVEGAADPLRDAALDLALQHQRVDDAAAVMNDHVLEDLEPERLGLYPDVGRVAPRRPGRSRRAVVPGRLEAWLLAFVQRWTRPGLRGELRRRLGSAAERVWHRVRKDGLGCQGEDWDRRYVH